MYGVKEVALDPLPEMVVDRTVGLVSLDREHFIRRLLDRKRFCEPDRGSSPREVERRSEAYMITVQYRAGSTAKSGNQLRNWFPRRSHR